MHVVGKALLWKYHELQGGDFTVKIRLSVGCHARYIKTGFTSKKEYWDERTGLPKPMHPRFRELIRRIDELIEDIDFEVKLAERNGELLIINELKDRVESKYYGFRLPKSQMKLFAFYDIIIGELEEQGRIGTADLVASNKSIISKVFGGKDKLFTSFTEWDFKRIEERINSVKSESSKSLYLRTFYRVWNIAIERKFCPEKLHPKYTIKFKAYKRIKIRKRAIPVNYIHDIEDLTFSHLSREYRSQQYLVFCYYSRGINFKDLVLLKHGENIRNGYIRYVRSKNRRKYEFKLHPKAQKVIEVFESYPEQSDAGYVFPILGSMHDTPRKMESRIDSALKDFNEDLLHFEKTTNCPKHITSYCIRHSFATTLRDKKVDVAIIKEAMGHETELQTATYLDEISDDIIADEIERALS
jgi:integrase